MKLKEMGNPVGYIVRRPNGTTRYKVLHRQPKGMVTIQRVDNPDVVYDAYMSDLIVCSELVTIPDVEGVVEFHKQFVGQKGKIRGDCDGLTLVRFNTALVGVNSACLVPYNPKRFSLTKFLETKDVHYVARALHSGWPVTCDGFTEKECNQIEINVCSEWME